MSFARYPDYKDSGVEWLGEVPGHWEVKRLKRNMRLLTEKTDRRDHPVALENIEGWTGRFITTDTEFQGEGIAFEPDDILFGKLRPYLAKAYRAEFSGEAVGDFHVMRPVTGINSRFVQYQILNRGFISIVDGSTFGSKMPRASWEFVGDMVVTSPTLSEQTQIAAFLDRETGKIDGLVAEQQRLIALLKEKRQAVISHAVTQGLNPHAPMKPSGIEWLGYVPAHWEVMPAKRVSSVFVPQRNKPDLNAEGEGHFWVTMEQMRSEEINSAELSVTESAARAAGTRVLSAGAVIASCVGTFGLAAINNVDVIINQQLQAFIPNERIEARFMRHCVVIAECYFEQIGTAATIAYVNQLGFANMPMVLPPKAEQHQINAFLAVESAKFDALTQETQRAIDLLAERRTALITAAVTGQIDVRALT